MGYKLAVVRHRHVSLTAEHDPKLRPSMTINSTRVATSFGIVHVDIRGGWIVEKSLNDWFNVFAVHDVGIQHESRFVKGAQR